MSVILHVDAWKLGIAFFVLMLLAGWVGVVVAPKVGQATDNGRTRIADASIALFALLLAFSFSGAADRYENRKGFLLDEAIAIGDFAATSSMIEDPERGQIRSELIGYVKERLAFGTVHIEAPEMNAITAHSSARQENIRSLLAAVISEKKSPTLHTPLMNGFNGLTMTHDKALYGSQNQVSDTIIILLVLFGMVSVFMIGKTETSHKQYKRPSIWIMVYITLVTAVFMVTVDLEQPHRGVMRSSKAPLIDLLHSLERPDAPDARR